MMNQPGRILLNLAIATEGGCQYIFDDQHLMNLMRRHFSMLKRTATGPVAAHGSPETQRSDSLRRASQSQRSGSLRGEEKSWKKDQGNQRSAVLLYSTRNNQSFGSYLQQVKFDPKARLEGFDEPFWSTWPRDKLLQRVQARIEVKKLLDELETRGSGGGGGGDGGAEAARRSSQTTSLAKVAPIPNADSFAPPLEQRRGSGTTEQIALVKEVSRESSHRE